MSNPLHPQHKEALQQLEKIQNSKDAAEVFALIEDLGQHGFFTQPQLHTVEAQREVRDAIDRVMGMDHIVTDMDVTDNLLRLKQRLEKYMRVAPVPPAEPALGTMGGTINAPQGPAIFAAQPPEPPKEPPAEPIPEAEPEATEAAETASAKPADVEKVTRFFQNILRKPSEFKAKAEEIKNPALRAVVNVLEKEKLWPGGHFDGNRFDQISLTLMEGKKSLPVNVKTAIAKLRAEGIINEEAAERKIAALQAEIENAEAEAKTLERDIESLHKTRMARRTNVAEATDKAELTNLSDKEKEMRGKSQEVLTKKRELKILETARPHLGAGEKFTPQQLLIKLLQALDTENKTPEEIAADAETLMTGEEAGKRGKKEKIWAVLHPSLQATLRELVKVKGLKGLEEKDMDEVLKLKNNVPGLIEWIEERGEKAKKEVPVLMAYLRFALAENTLNTLSRGHAETLLKNLRAARNKIIMDGIENNPDLMNKKPHEKTAAYLSEMNAWDENSVKVNEEILKELVIKSYVKKASTVAALIGGGIYAWPLLSFPAIGSALSYIGWGNIGAGAAHEIGRHAVKHFFPGKEKYYKQGATRALGWFVLGPIGLAAPELMTGLKFLFGKKEQIAAGMKTGAHGAALAGKGTAAVAKGGWWLTKGLAKAVSYPFRRNKNSGSTPSNQQAA